MPQPLLTSAACTLRAGGLLEEVEGESRGQEATYRARCILVDTEPKVRAHMYSCSHVWLTPACSVVLCPRSASWVADEAACLWRGCEALARTGGLDNCVCLLK